MTVLEKLELIRDKAVAKMNEIIEAYSTRAATKESESESVQETEAVAATAVEVATAVETPKATKISPIEGPKKGLNGGVSRSQLVRDFFMANKDARNKDAVEFLKKEHNVAVTPELVSVVRSKLNLPKRGKENRSQLIRDFFSRKPDARNRDAVEFLAGKGVDVSHELVSSVRAKLDPKAKKAPKALKSKKEGVSKSQVIRDFFAKKPDARNKDAIEFLAGKGVNVTAELVSSVRARIGGKVKSAKAKKARKSDLPLPAIVTKVLKGSREGHKLAELADLVLKAGYQYSGGRGRTGVLQNVYQAVKGLREEKTHPGWVGEIPVVVHDVESKRWKLNPKAKRDVA